MYAGGAEVGAEDAWWETALGLEELSFKGICYVDGALDIYKCSARL